MKTNLTPYLLIALGIIMFSGCKTARYFPSQQNIPLFKDKNETKIVGSVAASIGNKPIYSGELNVAHAISTNIFLAGNGAIFSNTNNTSGYLGELGAGYYKLLTDNSNKTWIFEVQGITGYGKPGIRSTEESYRMYIQPAIGFRSNYVELAFSTRITALYLNNTNPAVGRQVRDFQSNNRVILEYGNHFFAEPAFTFRVGYKNIMFHQQMCVLAQLTNKPIITNPVSFSMGISLRFPFEIKE